MRIVYHTCLHTNLIIFVYVAKLRTTRAFMYTDKHAVQAPCFVYGFKWNYIETIGVQQSELLNDWKCTHLRGFLLSPIFHQENMFPCLIVIS